MRAFVITMMVLCGCGPKQADKPSRSGVASPELFLEPVPDAVGVLSIAVDGADHVGPARVEVSGDRVPIEIAIEDIDSAAHFDVLVASVEPLEFGAVAGTAAPDRGTFQREGDQLRIEVERELASGENKQFTLQANLSPKPTTRPDRWMRPGTTLYYGVAFDDTPITQVVPMALRVRVGAGSDGSRMLTWAADIDPNKQLDASYERVASGRRQIPADQVRNGVRHSDAFLRGNDIPDATSIFVSMKTLADLKALGGASFHDDEVGPEGVLVRSGSTRVVVQADDELWALDAVVGVAGGGAGVYAIVDDPEHPLIVSATRPGYRIKLMAIGGPSQR